MAFDIGGVIHAQPITLFVRDYSNGHKSSLRRVNDNRSANDINEIWVLRAARPRFNTAAADKKEIRLGKSPEEFM